MAEFPTENGLRLSWAYAAYTAMHQTLGFRPEDDERTYILLAALDMVPRGTSAKRIDMPVEDYAYCFNAATAACEEIKFNPQWRRKRRR